MMDTNLSNMTLKDFFAALAMQGICANQTTHASFEAVAKAAYEQAEAMLKARDETQTD